MLPLRSIPVLLALLFVAACGGGGGGKPRPQPVRAAVVLKEADVAWMYVDPTSGAPSDWSSLISQHEVLAVGGTHGGWAAMALRFDLGSLPAGARILSADLVIDIPSTFGNLYLVGDLRVRQFLFPASLALGQAALSSSLAVSAGNDVVIATPGLSVGLQTVSVRQQVLDALRVGRTYDVLLQTDAPSSAAFDGYYVAHDNKQGRPDPSLLIVYELAP